VPLQALVFDVFGTVVDWRGGVMREIAQVAAGKGVAVDAGAMADAWRDRYDPAMAPVREGRRPWVKLDVLHRENLVAILGDFGLAGLSAAEIDDLAFAWRRLDPWPDAVPGLVRLKRRYALATLSNGNVALMVAMARRAGLPWDAVLGAEPTRSYKPDPACYLGTADMLGLAPADCMMVAAHPGDLVAAASCGLRTAFVPRPHEHGPGIGPEKPGPGDRFDVTASDFGDLARQLGC
jgi:2-haloacid dehalogenase